MRYLAIFLLAMNLTIGIWSIATGSWGWIVSLFGVAISVHMIINDTKYRAQTKAMYQRWADEDAALEARMAVIRRDFK